MSHALIIEDNMIISQLLQQRLTEIGFVSFDLAWTQQQALACAEKRFPDLIVLGDNLAEGSSVAAARAISQIGDVAILLATVDPQRSRRSLPADASILGPYPVAQIGIAASIALADVEASDQRVIAK